MHRTANLIDGFALAYERHGLRASASGRSAVLLHGWPGDHTDYRHVTGLLDPAIDVVVPDLRGFGRSDRHVGDPDGLYDAAAQARSVAGVIEELGLDRPVLAAYDIGSRIAQQLARERPDLVGALVLSPPLPGAGERVLDPGPAQEMWYMNFHRSGLATTLIDGDADRVRAYLKHFWTHWSGPGFALAEADLEHLVAAYSAPGAFTASTQWYRAGPGYVAASLAAQAPAPADRLAVPTEVLWQEHDPLFPRAWSDRVEAFFSDVRVHLIDGAGHFTPVEAPDTFAYWINHHAGS